MSLFVLAVCVCVCVCVFVICCVEFDVAIKTSYKYGHYAYVSN